MVILQDTYNVRTDIINLFTVKAQRSLHIRTVSPGPLLFSSDTGTDPLKNHKVTKLGHQMLGYHWCDSETPFFKWRFAGGPMLAHLW